MQVTNTDYIPGKELELLGVVQGNTVMTKHLGKDIMAGFKAIVGGEIHQFTELMKDARVLARQRMEEEAQSLGADAIINIRYTTSQIMDPAAEVLVYGTAVRFINK